MSWEKWVRAVEGIRNAGTGTGTEPGHTQAGRGWGLEAVLGSTGLNGSCGWIGLLLMLI